MRTQSWLMRCTQRRTPKLLNVGFIYPISDSRWVSPLILVPKKNSKWLICVDYVALNKATKKDHFLLPFIDWMFLQGNDSSLSWMD